MSGNVAWKTDKEFSKAASNGTVVTVKVNLLDLPREPLYSVEVGVSGKSGRVERFLQGVEEMEIAAGLMTDAWDYVLGKRGEWLARESHRLDKEKEKRQRHSENLERRKEENRKRANENGGGKKGKG